MRARDLGIRIGRLEPGAENAITDVSGVRVGHVTLIEGSGPRSVGRGPVRTGVTTIIPHDGDIWREPVFAGSHRLNGNGELTGLHWIREAGLLGGGIGLTNTQSVGPVPHQCQRVAQRVGLGVGRTGGYGFHGSGDLFLAFATGNRGLSRHAGENDPRGTVELRMVADAAINPLFEATVEATEEAIVNALLAAETMSGCDGVTAHALDPERLRELMEIHRRH